MFHEQFGLESVSKKSHMRQLRLREWPPNAKLLYAALDAKKKDPIGPVDESYAPEIDQYGFIKPSIAPPPPKPDLEIVVRPGPRFECLVGRRLKQASNLKFNSVKAEKPGKHTKHSVLSYLCMVAPRRPVFVVLMHAANDVGILNDKEYYWNSRSGLEIALDKTQVKRRSP